MLEIELTDLVRDEGTIVVFSGIDIAADRRVQVAVDHRPAQDIVNALAAGEYVLADVEPWQVIGS